MTRLVIELCAAFSAMLRKCVAIHKMCLKFGHN